MDPGKPFVGMSVGESVSYTRTVAESDVCGFAGVSGDDGPNHINAEAMRNTRYSERVAHGALIVGYMSACSTRLIERMDGRTAVSYGYDRIRFTNPVLIGDTIHIVYSVSSIDPDRRILWADLTASTQRFETVAVARHALMEV